MIIILIKSSTLPNPGARLLAEGLAGLPAGGHAAVRNETARPGARSGTDSGTSGRGTPESGARLDAGEGVR